MWVCCWDLQEHSRFKTERQKEKKKINIHEVLATATTITTRNITTKSKNNKLNLEQHLHSIIM